MTDGEKMVWAVAFTIELRYGKERLNQDYQTRAVTAAEEAWDAVNAARRAGGAINLAFGECDEIATMHREMLAPADSTKEQG